MSKKLWIGIFIGVFSLIGYVLIKGFVYNWNHDVQWQGERVANIGYFSGCHYRLQLIEGDDGFFSSEWNALSKKYEFTAEDVDKEIPSCLNDWRKNGAQPGMDVDIDKLETYQKKFLNREFSVFKEEK